MDSLETFEMYSLKLIKKALSEYDKPFISTSFGKDSLVTMHLVHRIDDSIPLVWAFTGVNHPTVYPVKKYYEEQGKKIITAKHLKTFWEIIEEYGFPIGARSTGSNKSVSNCCKYLKKEPMAQETEGYNLEFNGMTAFESWTRYTRIKADGDYKFVKSRGKDGRQVCMPIAWWHTEKVWAYIDKYSIKYPKVYDEELEGFTKRGHKEKVKGVDMDRGAIRLGCWTCPLVMKYTDKVIKQLRTYHPKLWKVLMKDKGLAKEVAKLKLNGQGDLFEGYFADNGDRWLEERPCFFDKI